MTTTINADRGEVGITLAGHVYTMQPTRQACNAIETEIGSVGWLSTQILGGSYFPKLHEAAVIVAECIRAAGRDSNDDTRAKVSTDKIEDMLFAEGLLSESVWMPLMTILGNLAGGGAKKKAVSVPSRQSEQTESTTAAS